MYMQRIDIPAIVMDPKRPLALKIAAGLLFLCLSAVIAPLWLAVCAAWFGAAALAKGIGGLAIQAWRTTVWAGEVVVGR
jgi:hypothetical protein